MEINKKKNETVATIIVTYNRKEYLTKCIGGILQQTKKVDSLFIIDNASSDGTFEYLKTKGIIQKYSKYDKNIYKFKININNNSIPVYYLKLNENIGSAGGFYEGLKFAFKYNFDWYWIMDDDVMPIPYTLEELLKYKEISKCIHPIHIYADGSEFIEHIKARKRKSENKKYFSVDACTFEGALIHKDIIKYAGFPDKDFFIVHDDKEFGLRVRKFTEIIYVEDAHLVKLIKIKLIKIGYKYSEIFPYWKIYYQIRNLFIIKQKHPDDSFSYLWMFYFIVKRFVVLLLFGPYRLKSIKNMIYGIFDGLTGKIGKTSRNIN